MDRHVKLVPVAIVLGNDLDILKKISINDIASYRN